MDIGNKDIILRNAVRAVIIDGDKILMAHLQKTDEYKFPGGGRNKSESVEEALEREVSEEVGYKVKKIGDKIGIITEYDTAKEGGNSIFKMISEYYLVEIENTQLKQSLEDYELELLFTPCWTEVKTAYEANMDKIIRKINTTPGIKRETIALGKLLNEYHKR